MNRTVASVAAAVVFGFGLVACGEAGLDVDSPDGVGEQALVVYSGGTVVISGTNAVDNVSVSQVGNVTVTHNGVTTTYSAAVTQIVFNGYGGNDTFTNNTAIPCVINGGDGDDTLYAGGGDDVINGGDGQDVIHGFGGNDIIRGGAAADFLYGDDGNDTIVAVGGAVDTITGGANLDNVWMDVADTITDASANENNGRYIHKIDAFMPLSYDGGVHAQPVTKDLNGPDLPDPFPLSADVGQDLRLVNYGDDPLFDVDGPHEKDANQGPIGDCYLLAKLSAIAAQQPSAIKKMIVDLGDGTYAVRFFRDNAAVYVRVDADLWTSQNQPPRPHYAESVGGSTARWASLVEKAYAFFRRQDGKYDSIEFGDGTDYADLGSFAPVTMTPPSDPNAAQVMSWVQNGSQPGSPNDIKIHNSVVGLLEWADAQLAAGKPVITSAIAGLYDTDPLLIDSWRQAHHIYVIDVIERDTSGNPVGIIIQDPTIAPNTEMHNFTSIYFFLANATSFELP